MSKLSSQKQKKSLRTWDEIRSDVCQMAEMSCRPTQQKVRADHVFDEDKSVKWNREQVELHNAAVLQEVKDLNTKKNKWRDELLEEICDKIVCDLDCRIGHNGAKKIYEYAYEEGHAYGVAEVFIHLDRLIDLFSEVLEVKP